MTREEAIKIFKEWAQCNYQPTREAAQLAIAALSHLTQEQVWKGCSWCNKEGKKPENWECSLLDDRGFSLVMGGEVVWTNANFCPICGRPLADKAVQMVMERLEAMYAK